MAVHFLMLFGSELLSSPTRECGPVISVDSSAFLTAVSVKFSAGMLTSLCGIIHLDLTHSAPLYLCVNLCLSCGLQCTVSSVPGAWAMFVVMSSTQNPSPNCGSTSPIPLYRLSGVQSVARLWWLVTVKTVTRPGGRTLRPITVNRCFDQSW